MSCFPMLAFFDPWFCPSRWTSREPRLAILSCGSLWHQSYTRTCWNSEFHGSLTVHDVHWYLWYDMNSQNSDVLDNYINDIIIFIIWLFEFIRYMIHFFLLFLNRPWCVVWHVVLTIHTDDSKGLARGQTSTSHFGRWD